MAILADESALIEQHQGFARALAVGIHRGLPPWVSLEDLVQYGLIGLTQAANAFDPARGAFKTFAYTRVRGAIFDGLARMRGVPRSTAERDAFRRSVVAQRGIDAISQELADHRLPGDGGGAAARAALRDAVGQIGLVILLSRAGTPQEPETADADDPTERASLTEQVAQAKALIGRLPEDEATIVRMHYFESCSLTECAAALGKHKAWISRLHARALERMRQMLEGADR